MKYINPQLKLQFAVEEIYDYVDKRGGTLGLTRHLIALYGHRTAAEALLIAEGDMDTTLTSYYGPLRPTVLFRAYDRLKVQSYAIPEDTQAYIAYRLIQEVEAKNLRKCLDRLLVRFQGRFEFLMEGV